MHIVLIAHGDFSATPRELHALTQAQRIIAADGGAECTLAAGYLPHLVVGDMDSISAEAIETLRRQNVPLEWHPKNKDQTDLQLALEAARGASEITILGALGGRRDHEWANVLLLRHAPCPARIISGATTVYLLHTPGQFLKLRTTPGDTVSLIPLATTTGITLKGLAYPLDNATLHLGSSRGVSNEAVGHTASVQIQSGTLLVTHISSA
jgi:thiamine pyrophosphokinase